LIKEVQEIKHQKELKEKTIKLHDAKLQTEKIIRTVTLFEKLNKMVSDWFK